MSENLTLYPPDFKRKYNEWGKRKGDYSPILTQSNIRKGSYGFDRAKCYAVTYK
jgi:hypothetical protein